MIAMVTNWVDRIIWGDALQKHGLPGRIVTNVLRHAYAVLRDIFSGQLTLRAMSLVYTTLLSIVPLVAFSFSVLKGFGKHKELEDYIYSVQPLGPEGVEITEQLMTLVHNVNGNVLGGIGLAFLIYTAVTMVKKVEDAFNYVWYVTKPRSFAKRFTEYMFVLLIGPVAIVIALGAIASVGNESVVVWLQQNSVFGPVFSATSRLTPYLLVMGVFAFMYWYMPNTKVRVQSALIGGLAGGMMWATLGMIFATFIISSVRTQAIYAGFAIAISALIWLYLNWLILLIGSQIAFYYQNPAYLRIGRREPRLSNAMRERVALNIMYLVGKEFRNPKSGVTLRSVGRALSIPTITLAPIATGLESSGILANNENGQLLPGRDMSNITLDEILSVVRADGETGSHRDPRWTDSVDNICQQLDNAIAETIGTKTLIDLLKLTDA